MTARQFETLVEEALALIPAEFRQRIENVGVVIEHEPSPELLDQLGVPEGETLFGLYSGTPLIARTSEYSALPDQITIFRGPLLEEFSDPDELRIEVARTVIHEVAHYFGIGEDRLAELGWD